MLEHGCVRLVALWLSNLQRPLRVAPAPRRVDQTLHLTLAQDTRLALARWDLGCSTASMEESSGTAVAGRRALVVFCSRERVVHTERRAADAKAAARERVLRGRGDTETGVGSTGRGASSNCIADHSRNDCAGLDEGTGHFASGWAATRAQVCRSAAAAALSLFPLRDEQLRLHVDRTAVVLTRLEEVRVSNYCVTE